MANEYDDVAIDIHFQVYGCKEIDDLANKLAKALNVPVEQIDIKMISISEQQDDILEESHASNHPSEGYNEDIETYQRWKKKKSNSAPPYILKNEFLRGFSINKSTSVENFNILDPKLISKEKKRRRRESKKSIIMLNKAISSFYRSKEISPEKFPNFKEVIKMLGSYHIPRVIEEYKQREFSEFHLQSFLKRVLKMIEMITENMGHIQNYRDESHFSTLLIELFKVLNTLITFYRRHWSKYLCFKQPENSHIENEYKVVMSYVKRHLYATCYFLYQVHLKQSKLAKKLLYAKRHQNNNSNSKNNDSNSVNKENNTNTNNTNNNNNNNNKKTNLIKLNVSQTIKKMDDNILSHSILIFDTLRLLPASTELRILKWCFEVMKNSLQKTTVNANFVFSVHLSNIQRMIDQISQLFEQQNFSISHLLFLFLNTIKNIGQIIQHKNISFKNHLTDLFRYVAQLCKLKRVFFELNSSCEGFIDDNLTSNLVILSSKIVYILKDILYVINYS